MGLGFLRADALRRLWRGTGISRKRKLQLVDSLVGSIILYSLETLNMTPTEHEALNASQRRFYRRALDFAPPFTANLKSLEIVKKDDLLRFLGPTHSFKPWATRVKEARVRLLHQCRYAPEGDPLRCVLFAPNSNHPKHWHGTKLPGANKVRGDWLSNALLQEVELSTPI